MQTYELLVRERAVVPNSRDMTLVRTSVGIDRIHVLFDSEEWMGFPVTVTFAQGDESVTAPLPLSRVRDSDWAVEGECDIPWEVIGSNGRIRVTFQGTDSEGRHIITAKGSPLSVEEAGDVLLGEVPSDAPTVDQWQQAYAEAMVALNEAADLVASLRAQLDGIVSDARDEIDARAESVGAYVLPAATASSLGGVKVGSGLEVTADGTLSADGMTTKDRSEIARLRAIADGVTESAFESGVLKSAKVRREALPVATLDSPGVVIPDGITVDVDEDGMLYMLMKKRLDPATTSELGGVKPDGTTITVDPDGTIHGTEQTPIATTSTTGKVKPDGTSITIDPDGTVHGTEQTTIATTSTAGKVKPDGETITVDEDGTIRGAPGYRYGYVHDSMVESKAFVFGDESDGVYEFVNLTEVKSVAFREFSSITAAALPVCVTVGEQAFFRCANLTSINLPVCTSIGESAFFVCSSLSSANIPACETVGAGAFYYCSSLASVNMPKCTTIGSIAFCLCSSLSSVNIPACMSLGDGAFSMCVNLASVSLPVCTSIGDMAFTSCSSLEHVNLPACRTIGECAFSGCSALSSIDLRSCTTVKAEAFNSCTSLRSINIPFCKTVGSYAFSKCLSLKSISLPHCSAIGRNAFHDCISLSIAYLPFCTTVDSSAFYGCGSLASVNLQACGTVGSGAFNWCSRLASISLPACTSVGSFAFGDCHQLSVATLPRCAEIGTYAFYNCHNLVSLYLTSVSRVPSIRALTFNSTPIFGYSESAGRYGLVYVPQSLYGDFVAASVWSDISSRIIAR